MDCPKEEFPEIPPCKKIDGSAEVASGCNCLSQSCYTCRECFFKGLSETPVNFVMLLLTPVFICAIKL